MFCMNCGKEFPNEARFCMHCGVSVPSTELQTTVNAPPISTFTPAISGPSKAAPAASARPATPRLNDYYVLDWEGECPSCGFIHTSETGRCVNDDARIAVAFRDTSSPGIAKFPLHAADLRCLNDCGVRIQAFPCSRCGAAIKGKYLRFRFPASTQQLHKLYHYVFRSVWLVALVVLIVCTGTLASDISEWFSFMKYNGGSSRFSDKMPPALAKVLFPYVFYRFLGFFLALPFVRKTQKRWRWYAGKEWFDFTDVAKDLEQHEKAKRLKEAIATAIATHEATKPIKFGV